MSDAAADLPWTSEEHDALPDPITYRGMDYTQASREASHLISRYGWFRAWPNLAVLREIMTLSRLRHRHDVRKESDEDGGGATVVVDRHGTGEVFRRHFDTDLAAALFVKEQFGYSMTARV